MKIVWFALAFTACFDPLLAPALAYSQGACGSRTEIIGALGSDYKEAPVVTALTQGGTALIEILTSETGDTWSLLVTKPNGLTCLLGAGEAWTVQEWKAPATGEQM